MGYIVKKEFFDMNRLAKPVKTKEMFARDLKISSMNILLMIALTLVNIIMIIANANTTFFFSAAVPMYLVLLFSELCGMRPAEFYEEFYPDWQASDFLPSGLFWGVVAVAVVLVAVYFALWFFSRKKKVFSIILMVVFALDTIGLLGFSLLYGFGMTTLIDIAFHAWVFYYLILALKAWDGMEYAPSEAELAAQYAPIVPEVTPDTAEDTAEETAVVVEEDAEKIPDTTDSVTEE